MPARISIQAISPRPDWNDKARSRQKESSDPWQKAEITANAATLQAQEKLVDVINRCEIENTIETLIKQRFFRCAGLYKRYRVY